MDRNNNISSTNSSDLIFKDEVIVSPNCINGEIISSDDNSLGGILKDPTTKSGKLQDVLGEIPSWIQRWGICTISLVFLLLLTICFLIRTPDIVVAKVTLTAEVPTENIIAKVNGKISELYVKNNDLVNAGDYLGVIENTADLKDIIYLKMILENILVNPDTINSISFRNLHLGDMQTQFSEFDKLVKEKHMFLEMSYYPQKILYTNERLSHIEEKQNEIANQIRIISEQHNLSKKSFIRDSLLFVRKSLSQEEFETSKNELLQNELTLQNQRSVYTDLLAEKEQVKESILDIEKQYNDRNSELNNNIIAAATNILSQIKTWEMNYLLKASVKGRITFTKYWSVTQNVTSGEPVFFIAPDKSLKMFIKGTIPVDKSGKVKTGQIVNILFSNFPYQEFGVVKGKVISKSLVPSDSKYSVDMELIDGLKTTYHKTLPYSQDMEGTAEIVTDNILLAEKLFAPIRSILNKNMN